MQNLILENLNEFIRANELREEFNELPEKDNKLVIINNSFLFRSNIKTRKNIQYLGFVPTNFPVIQEQIVVVSGLDLKSNYRLFEKNDPKISSILSLEEAIERELELLGEIVFVLMGEIDDNIELRTRINHSIINIITFSPSLEETTQIDAETIKCKNIEDEENTWHSIEQKLQSDDRFEESDIDSLKLWFFR